MLEALARGIPVVATAWSGNTDFTGNGNGVDVPYRLVPVEDPAAIYSGSNWAEPDITAAAAGLRRLADDTAFYDPTGRASLSRRLHREQAIPADHAAGRFGGLKAAFKTKRQSSSTRSGAIRLRMRSAIATQITAQPAAPVDIRLRPRCMHDVHRHVAPDMFQRAQDRVARALAGEIERIGDLGVTQAHAGIAPLLDAKMNAERRINLHDISEGGETARQVDILLPAVKRQPLIE